MVIVDSLDADNDRYELHIYDRALTESTPCQMVGIFNPPIAESIGAYYFDQTIYFEKTPSGPVLIFNNTGQLVHRASSLS